MKTSDVYNKHLTLSKRNIIEQSLNENKNFKDIAELISKSPVTVSNEIKRHRILAEKSRFGYSKGYSTNCSKISKPPYVCNGCDHRKGCRKNRYYYYALESHNNYLEKLSLSRKGIDLTSEEFNYLNSVVKSGIEKGHSFSIICNNHKGEFNVGKRTLYNYQEKGYLDVLNIDLPRKVRYKKRKKREETIIRKTKIRENRTYQDFLKYKEEYFINNGIDVGVVQMDTVEGIKGESVLLTLMFTQSNFLLAFKTPHKTMECVCRVFDYLKDTLGNELFYEMFPVILTDNGSEFFNPDYIEDNGIDIPKTKMFYCDPNRSDQKGSIEVTHEFIRRYIPKGISFNSYSDEDIILMVNNINSVSRDKFGGCSSYGVQEIFTPSKFFEKLNLKKIYGLDVIIKPSLLKQKDNTNK